MSSFFFPNQNVSANQVFGISTVNVYAIIIFPSDNPNKAPNAQNKIIQYKLTQKGQFLRL